MHTIVSGWEKQPWNHKRLHIQAFFDDNSIKHANPKELEEFLVVLANATPDSQMVDDKAEMEKQAIVIRNLLQVRINEELRDVVSKVVAGQPALQSLVERIHRIDVWILIVGTIAALASVILLVVEIAKAL